MIIYYVRILNKYFIEFKILLNNKYIKKLNINK